MKDLSDWKKELKKLKWEEITEEIINLGSKLELERFETEHYDILIEDYQKIYKDLVFIYGCQVIDKEKEAEKEDEENEEEPD